MKIDILFHNKWLQVRKATLNNGFEYVYTHSPWCNSQGVAVLGYRDIETEGGFLRREYLGRYEVCPAHGEELKLCSLTGGMDKEGELPTQTAVRELREESGYIVNESQLIHLGIVNNNKASDYKIHLFAVDLTNAKRGEAVGDGTQGEKGAFADWVNEWQAINCSDPLVGTMIARLKIK